MFTTDPGLGGDDEITDGDGDDIVLAGDGDDWSSSVRATTSCSATSCTIDLDAECSPPIPVGGDDDITAGDGDDIVLAGDGDDLVVVGGGDNIVFGDLGEMTWIGCSRPIRLRGDDDITRSR
jgi:Ca2+-binding RTX toxin-like protein